MTLAEIISPNDGLFGAVIPRLKASEWCVWLAATAEDELKPTNDEQLYDPPRNIAQII